MTLAEPAASISVVESGPLRATVEIKRRILHSDYVQRVSLQWNNRRLDFETTINWQERHTLLKAAFPVDVLSPVATYEIQWGNVERPTHRNTSWDLARFDAEVRASQARRLVIYEALRNGAYYPWDFQPLQKASERYMRNHMDLDDLERRARF